MKRNALSHSNPDEYLYGRAGYLYTLMFLRRELGGNVIDPQLITDIFEAMIKSGRKLCSKNRFGISSNVQMARFRIHGSGSWRIGDSLSSS